ncbi:putative integral membrane protein [Theileria parva strain Muguga]|uniref:putative integral membrane protein n=1 Tax=Theileria parva strain Muguga TaxID=333668 RepID=UPI001C61ABD9|nr:putative integral membrane protein [Theileria parva strain Muguga]EAN33406.2 putative integral membrane protein [Theileria parva strain Muguga]
MWKIRSLTRNFVRYYSTSNKLLLDKADSEVKNELEKRLLEVLPQNWYKDKVIKIQKIISNSFLILLFTGGFLANFFDDRNKELSRMIITSEIHLMSSYLAFTSGIQSGLQHYLSCGIVQRRFNWIPHYRQGVAISGVLASTFASSNSDVSSKRVLSILLMSYLGILGNEYLFAKLKLSPQWMKLHSKKKAISITMGILLLLMCESQVINGKTPEL